MLVSGDKNKDGFDDEDEDEIQGFVFSRLKSVTASFQFSLHYVTDTAPWHMLSQLDYYSVFLVVNSHHLTALRSTL